MKGLLLRAASSETVLEMIYLDSNHEITKRKLIIKEINDEYIRAFCLMRQEMRTFKRENILSIMPEPSTKHRYLH